MLPRKMAQYYSSAADKAYSPDQVSALFGFDTETTDIEILNASGLYPVKASTPSYDVTLFDSTFTWGIIPHVPSGEAAERVYTAVDKPLATAKTNGIATLMSRADTAVKEKYAEHDLNDTMMGVLASYDQANLPSTWSTAMTELHSITNQLHTDIAAVNAATTVTDIDNIVNP